MNKKLKHTEILDYVNDQGRAISFEMHYRIVTPVNRAARFELWCQQKRIGFVGSLVKHWSKWPDQYQRLHRDYYRE